MKKKTSPNPSITKKKKKKKNVANITQFESWKFKAISIALKFQ